MTKNVLLVKARLTKKIFLKSLQWFLSYKRFSVSVSWYSCGTVSWYRFLKHVHCTTSLVLYATKTCDISKWSNQQGLQLLSKVLSPKMSSSIFKNIKRIFLNSKANFLGEAIFLKNDLLIYIYLYIYSYTLLIYLYILIYILTYI